MRTRDRFSNCRSPSEEQAFTRLSDYDFNKRGANRGTGEAGCRDDRVAGRRTRSASEPFLVMPTSPFGKKANIPAEWFSGSPNSQDSHDSRLQLRWRPPPLQISISSSPEKGAIVRLTDPPRQQQQQPADLPGREAAPVYAAPRRSEGGMPGQQPKLVASAGALVVGLALCGHSLTHR